MSIPEKLGLSHNVEETLDCTCQVPGLFRFDSCQDQDLYVICHPRLSSDIDCDINEK